MARREPAALRLCLALVRAFGPLVPRAWRDDWRREWNAEVRHRWYVLERGHDLDWRTQMDLVRRALGALPDAAWLRRQLTADAEVVHDVRHGIRMLAKSPAFTLSAIFILALGIAGTVSIASLLDTLLFRPLPYVQADRIVTIWQRHAARAQAREDVSPANFLDWRERSRSFAHMAGVIPYSFDYTGGGGEPEVFFGAQVTEGFWDAIGMPPALGRGFLPEEHVKGARRAVILSYGLWQRRFGGDPSIVNRAISLDGEPWTVVGVLPKEFAPQLMPRPGELGVWTPKIIQESEKRVRGSAWWNVVARLKPGVTPEQAQREMDTISTALAREYPVNKGLSAEVVPMRDHLMGGLERPLFIMFGAVILVLGIGAANVASLLLARGMQREREFAIRSALGAGRARIMRQLVTESLLLSALAATCGVVAAHWIIQLIVSLAPGGVIRLHDASIDARMLAVAAVVTIGTALVFGLVPAFQFARPGRDLVRERTSTGIPRFVRRGLVAAEIAFALVLLCGAGLLIRSFVRLMSVDPGFSPRNAVALQVFAYDRNGAPARTRIFFAATLERLRAIPGVEAAGAVSAMPFMIANIDVKSPITVVGRDVGNETERRGTYLTIVMPGYFETMSIPLREGRFIESGDTERAPFVAVISDALRKREWPADSPIGRHIRVEWQGKPVEAEIVGVVSQIRHDSLDSPARPEVFLPLAQVPFPSMTYVIRGQGDPAALIAAGKRAVWTVDPLQTFYDVATVRGLVDATVVRQRFSMTLMTAFAALALVLCATGIYGLISFTTVQRTREIGVRMALGADGHAIRRMVLREGSVLVASGIGLGLVSAMAAARMLQTLLFEVRPDDPVTFALVCALVAVVGLAASYFPARRATLVDPLVALRVE